MSPSIDPVGEEFYKVWLVERRYKISLSRRGLLILKFISSPKFRQETPFSEPEGKIFYKTLHAEVRLGL